MIVIGAAIAIVHAMTTSICTCCTSFVMRVMSDGAPKRRPPGPRSRSPCGRGSFGCRGRTHRDLAAVVHRGHREDDLDQRDEKAATRSLLSGRVGSKRLAAAGAAAGPRRRLLALGALFDLERVAAAARRGDVRVVDREAALQAVDEVDLRPLEIRSAVWVDGDLDPRRRPTGGRPPGHLSRTPGRTRTRSSRRPARRCADTPASPSGSSCHQLPDLRRGTLCEGDEGFLFDRRHCSHGSNVPRLLNPRSGPNFVNSRYPHR